MSASQQEEAHTGPIKTPGQLLLAVFFSFVVPVFAIIGLVYYVVSGPKPSGSAREQNLELTGLNKDTLDRVVSDRIRKVGSVEIRDANRPLKAGQEVYAAQCSTCHTAGVGGAPKLGDAGAWAPRIKTGFEALVNSSLKGKGAMPAQSGGDFEDLEIARAVAYMANSAGGNFAEPQRPAVDVAAPAAGAAAAAPTPAAVAAATAPAAAPAPAAVSAAAPATAPAATAVAAAGGAGEALYKQACSVCHVAGVANAPKFGDKAAWAPRVATGVPALVQSVIKGKGAMPPKGGAAGASEADIRAAVQYMVNAVK